jgi:uncharacterized protein YutE (UPF0331/DUF86 family)
MLCEAGIISGALRDRLKAMTGFRNIAVHDYRKLNLDVVRHILEEHLHEFREFGATVLKAESMGSVPGFPPRD